MNAQQTGAAIGRADITAKGRELSDDLAEWIGTTRDILKTCSLICRAATTHHHYMEYECNGYADWRGNWDQAAADRAEIRIERLEARITALVEALPHTDDGPVRVEFQGDPRGCTVKLHIPGESYPVCVPIR